MQSSCGLYRQGAIGAFHGVWCTRTRNADPMYNEFIDVLDFVQYYQSEEDPATACGGNGAGKDGDLRGRWGRGSSPTPSSTLIHGLNLARRRSSGQAPAVDIAATTAAGATETRAQQDDHQRKRRSGSQPAGVWTFRAQCDNDIARIGNPIADAVPRGFLAPTAHRKHCRFRVEVKRYDACKPKRRGSSRRKFGHSRWVGAHVPSNACRINRCDCLCPTDASYQPTGSNLDTSKKYRLIFGVEQPAHCQGLKKSKSDYVRFNGSDIFWGRPFGPAL